MGLPILELIILVASAVAGYFANRLIKSQNDAARIILLDSVAESVLASLAFELPGHKQKFNHIDRVKDSIVAALLEHTKNKTVAERVAARAILKNPDLSEGLYDNRTT